MEELTAVHTPDHVHAIMAGNPPNDGDTYFDTAHSPVAALVAAGSVVQMTEEVCAGRANNGFCVVRPPGHHATKGHAMGFCIFNNVAVAAQKARETLGVKRVMIFDWDVHHGNGVQDIFYEDPDVLYVSVHRGGVEQSFFYPLTGTADKVSNLYAHASSVREREKESVCGLGVYVWFVSLSLSLSLSLSVVCVCLYGYARMRMLVYICMYR